MQCRKGAERGGEGGRGVRRDDRLGRCGGAREQVVALARGRGRQDRFEQLADRAKREFALELAPPGSQHAQARCGGPLAGGHPQGGLAGARNPLDDNEAPPSAARLLTRGGELRELGVAFA